MKNTIIKFSLLPYLILFVNTLYISAQENTASFHLGIKAGVNFANVYDEQGEDFQADGKIGFAGGAFMTIPISTWLGVQPEVLFSQKGFKATGTLLNNPYTLTRTTNHFDVPIYLAIMPIKSLTLLVGPQFSFLTRQKDVLENSAHSFEQIQEFNNDNLRKNTLGLSLGLDVNVSKIVVGARGGWDITNNHGDGTSSTPRYKNVWAQATIGIRLL